MNQQNEYKSPSKKARLISLPIFFMATPLWNTLLIMPLIFARPLAAKFPAIGSFFVFALSTAFYGAFFYCLWKLSNHGMTIRHFLAGYQVRHKDGKIPNVFVLYAREFVAVATSFLVLLKVMVPALMKRGLSAGLSDEDKHIVVKNSNGDHFVSRNNIGTMRDNQMNAEVQASMQNEIVKIHHDEWFHDKLFSTAPVIASRMEVLGLKKTHSTKPNNTQKAA